ncbi:hypothetical protein GCM10011613_07720 [Cellvibrio zantedeschiae]|uniref:Uncharacterized protein n=1 Tax=Cellvibrio zantedeschiae TaxID=1237077 RepID=A0ABQ3AS94_9GAMM|nr:hypothetical protein [Cellvibrio zantedeschiae]GGY66262.1 hypothetical protein GCM10011613_07720 [Cellvibrio zantedeschiae]
MLLDELEITVSENCEDSLRLDKTLELELLVTALELAEELMLLELVVAVLTGAVVDVEGLEPPPPHACNTVINVAKKSQ